MSRRYLACALDRRARAPSAVRVHVVGEYDSCSVPGCWNCAIPWLPQGEDPVPVEGVYDGVLSHDVETSWSEVKDDNPRARVWQGTAKVRDSAGVLTVETISV
jgi:hypothetical protein